MNIKLMPLSDLRIAEVNVRRHTDKQIAEYVRSIKSFEQVKPIVIDDTGEIICGNGLFLALQQMGRTECYCHVMEGITPNQKKKLMLADNRVYELGITDIDAFEDIVRSLGDDTDIPGWDADLISALNATPQEVDDFVSGYGSFDPAYTDKIKETKPAPAIVPSAPVINPYAAPSAQLQQSSQPVYTGNPISITPDMPPVQTGNAGQEAASSYGLPVAMRPHELNQRFDSCAGERYIVCPKCGERICL